MKKILLVSAIAVIAASCNKPSVKDNAPLLKTTSKTLATSGCTIADGTKYFPVAYGVSPSGIAVDGKGNIYNAGYIYDYNVIYGGAATDTAGSGYLQKATLNGTQEWITPVYNATGWGIQPLTPSAYSKPTIKTDAAGNIYALYYKTTTFHNFIIPTAVLAKYNAAGTKLWQNEENLGYNDYIIQALSIDDNGNVYICENLNTAPNTPPTSIAGGSYPTPPTTVPLATTGAFVQKFDGNGNTLAIHSLKFWLAPGTFIMDKNGFIYGLSHNYNGDQTYTSYLSKIDWDGNIVWKRDIGAAYATSIAGDDSGNTLLWLTENVTQPGSSHSAAQTDIGEFSPSGAFRWRLNNASPGISSITFDKQGNVYIIGAFSGSFDFDPSANNITLVSVNQPDLFVQKFNQQGTLVWVKQRQIPELAGIYAAATDDANLYITGTNGTANNYDATASAFGLRMSLCL